MKSIFIIKDIVALKSNQEDRLNESQSKFKGVNVRVILNKVIDINRGVTSTDNETVNIGNTNPRACESFDKFVKGFEISKQTDHNGKPYERVTLLSEKLVKGAMFEFEYVVKVFKEKEYLIPVGEAAYKGYVNPKSIIRSSSEPLF